MASDFTAYVDEWDALVGVIAALKKKLAPLQRRELEMRKNIATSVQNVTPLREGVNDHPLPDGRVVSINYKLTRSVDSEKLPQAEAEYRKLNDTTHNFGELFRVKYEVNLEPYRELTDMALLTLADAVTTKEAAPEVKLK